MIFEAKGVASGYGRIEVLRGVTVHLDAGEVVSVLGPNGAGKSTLLRTVSGLVKCREGSIWLDGVRLDKLRADRVAGAGFAHVPEGRHVFPGLSVLENLQMGEYARSGSASDNAAIRERIFNLFPVLGERTRQLAGTLSGGEQQMLAMARGLVSSPKVLALDEPSMGLAPIIVSGIFRAVAEIAAQGTAVLLMEQNAYRALEVSQRAYILEHGRVVLEGPSAELAESDRLGAAYLGGHV